MPCVCCCSSTSTRMPCASVQRYHIRMRRTTGDERCVPNVITEPTMVRERESSFVSSFAFSTAILTSSQTVPRSTADCSKLCYASPTTLLRRSTPLAGLRNPLFSVERNGIKKLASLKNNIKIGVNTADDVLPGKFLITNSNPSVS